MSSGNPGNNGKMPHAPLQEIEQSIKLKESSAEGSTTEASTAIPGGIRSGAQSSDPAAIANASAQPATAEVEKISHPPRSLENSVSTTARKPNQQPGDRSSSLAAAAGLAQDARSKQIATNRLTHPEESSKHWTKKFWVSPLLTFLALLAAPWILLGNMPIDWRSMEHDRFTALAGYAMEYQNYSDAKLLLAKSLAQLSPTATDPCTHHRYSQSFSMLGETNELLGNATEANAAYTAMLKHDCDNHFREYMYGKLTQSSVKLGDYQHAQEYAQKWIETLKEQGFGFYNDLPEAQRALAEIQKHLPKP